MLDAAILARLEKTWAPRGEYRSQAWIDRNMSRVSASLKAMSRGLGEKPWCAGLHMSLGDIAVGCALFYLDFRFSHIDWRGEHPNLARLAEKLAARKSFIDTAPAPERLAVQASLSVSEPARTSHCILRTITRRRWPNSPADTRHAAATCSSR